MGCLRNLRLLVTLALMCSWSAPIMADDGTCTAGDGAGSLRTKIQTQEDEITELKLKVEALKKDVEVRDKKGMDLMRSYKTCSDKFDELSDKEEEQQWKPDTDKMMNDMTYLHTENQKNIKDLQTCEKRRKNLRKKITSLKKSQENCLTAETLAVELNELKEIAPDRSKYVMTLTNKYGKCLIENSGKDQDRSASENKGDSTKKGGFESGDAMEKSVSGLKQQLSRCRMFSADIQAAYDTCEESLHDALLKADNLVGEIEHGKESVMKAFERTMKVQKELHALKEQKAADSAPAETQCKCLTSDSLMTELSTLKEEYPERLKYVMQLLEKYGKCLLALFSADRETDDLITKGMTEKEATVPGLQEELGKCRYYSGDMREAYDTCKEFTDELTTELTECRKGRENVDDLTKENIALKEAKEECKKTENIIDIYASNAKDLEKKNKDLEKSLKECQQQKEKAKKRDEPKAELYSLKAETVKVKETCEEKMEALEKENKRLNKIIDEDTQYGIACMNQKQNIKVSRWFLKKKYFAEINKLGKVAKELDALKQTTGNYESESNAKEVDSTKVKHLESKVEKYEVEVSDLEKSLAKCKASKEVTSGDAGECGDVAAITDERNNCQETLRFAREKHAKLEKDMLSWKPECDTLQKRNDLVEEDYKECYIAKDQMDFKFRGMEMLTTQLEKDVDDEKAKAEKFGKSAKEAIADASNYMFSFAVTMIVLVIMLTINLYGFIANYFEESDTQRKERIKEEKEHKKNAERADRRATKKLK